MFKLSIKLFAVLLVAVSIIFFSSSTAKSATSAAEKLLTVVPDDMLAFVATSGADELKPAFEKTFLSRIWNDPGTQTFYQSIKNEILKKIEAQTDDPNDIKTFETIRDFVKMVLRRPIIIGAASKDVKDKVPVYGFAVLEAGNRKAQINSQLAKLEALAGDGEIIEIKVGSHTMHRLKENDFDGYWGWVGNYLVFVINEDEGLAIKYLENAKVRSAPDYLSKVTCSGDGLVVYGNYEKCLGILEAVAAKEDELKQYNQFKAVTRELGIDKIKLLVARVGFSGSDLVIDKFVRIPSPRTGLPGSLKPAQLSMLDMVHRHAVRVVALNCDVAGIYDAIFRAIKAVSKNEAYPGINEAIAEFESEAKFQLRGGLLESLSGPMVCFTLPAGAMMEAPGGGAVLIAKLKDKALFEQTMLAFGQFAAAQSEGLLQVSSQVQNGRTLHTWAIMPLAMMQVMPTWTIVDGHAVIATNTALCNSAIVQMTSKTNSIRDTEGYKTATAKMANNPLLFAYTDSKVQFNQMMMGVQQFWPMVTMMASKSDIKLPFMLPSLSHIANDMQPACSYCFSDSQGYYSHYRGPGIEQGLGSLAGVSMAAGILMPALARTRQVAYRMVSGTNLSAIGKACMVYANDHGGKYPDNLQQLIGKADLSPKCLTSKFVPKGSAEPGYIYISGQDAKMHPQNIIAYDNPVFCPDGVNVLFNDAHVEWVKREEFLKILETTYKRLGRDMPEIKFKNSVELESLSKPQLPRSSKTPHKSNELHNAVRQGNFEKVRILVDQGANVNATIKDEWTPLLLAVRFGHTDIANFLIDHGANIYARTTQEMTPLLFAIMHDHKDIEKILIDKGAKPGIIAESIRGDTNAVEALLKISPDMVNVKHGQFTPLHWAAYNGNLNTAKLLIDKGANVNACSDNASPLYWAVRKNFLDIVRLLIDNGANVNAKSKHRANVLHYVTATEVAELLIERGADVNARDKGERTPLHTIASQNAHKGALKLLLSKDADINAKHSDEVELGATKLQAAVAELLITNGADVNAKDIKGHTPLDYAKQGPYDEVIKVLQKYQQKEKNN